MIYCAALVASAACFFPPVEERDALVEEGAREAGHELIAVDSAINFLRRLGSDPTSPDAFHVVNVSNIKERLRLWEQGLPRVYPHYAIKANHDPVLVSALARLNLGFDVASVSEIRQVLSHHVDPSRIIFAHPRKSCHAISEAAMLGVVLTTFDSMEEMEKVVECGGNTFKLVLRIKTHDEKSTNPLSSKFGANLPEAFEMIDAACSRGFPLVGIAFHVGSNCRDLEAYRMAICEAALLFDYASTRWGREFELLDIGGGWPGDDDAMFLKIAELVSKELDARFAPHVQVIAEPGRFFSTQNVQIAMRIVGKKAFVVDGKKQFAYFLTNGAYGSFVCSIYYSYNPVYLKAEGWHFLPVRERGGEELYPSLLWGPTCDAGDKISEGFLLPELEEGEFIYTDNAGAYTLSLETRFNQITPSRGYYVVEE